MNKYITEFIGTFFLVLTIGCTVIGAPGRSDSAARHRRGAHGDDLRRRSHFWRALQSAVTLGVWIRGKCLTRDVVPYIIAQIVAAVAAAAIVKYLRPTATIAAGTPLPGPALIAEFLFTFALVYVVLNAATAEGTSGNSFYGLAIGMTVMAGAFAVGDISGGAFNPAVAVGASVLGLFSWGNLWIYLVANLAAGVVAGFAFKALNPPGQTTPIATDLPPFEKPLP
jgi:aquaporin Z